MPDGMDEAEGGRWLMTEINRNLLTAGAENDIIEHGGVYAIVGPTGVGKTTTTAKLAARGVVRHGAERVALLTTDTYRIGAHEQLRIYGTHPRGRDLRRARCCRAQVDAFPTCAASTWY
jgi:flagellar biosynthesis protein FlhF